MAIFATTPGHSLCEATFEPFTGVQKTDTIEHDRAKVYLVRNGIRIQERELQAVQVVVPEPVQTLDEISKIRFYRNDHMAGIAVTLTGARIQENNHVAVDFSDSTSMEFSSIEELTVIADSLDQNIGLAKQVLVAQLIRAQPSLDDPHAIDGTTCAIDTSAAQPVMVVRP